MILGARSGRGASRSAERIITMRRHAGIRRDGARSPGGARPSQALSSAAWKCANSRTRLVYFRQAEVPS